MMNSVPGRVTGSAGGSAPSIMLEKFGQNELCSLVQVDADRSQRHHLELGFRNIVEPDNRYVAGDLPACLVKRPKDPHRHLVVGGEDCGDIVARCQLAPLLVAEAADQSP